MAYREVEGDLFAVVADAFGHGINAYGDMGEGIASIFARRWPDMFETYRGLCAHGLIEPGRAWGYTASDGARLYGMVTEDVPGHARLDWVASAVGRALDDLTAQGGAVLAVPKIGAGLGGLAWSDVRQTLQEVSARQAATLLVVIRPPSDC